LAGKLRLRRRRLQYFYLRPTLTFILTCSTAQMQLLRAKLQGAVQFFCTSIAFFVVILASKKAKRVLHSQAHDNHWVVLIYSVVLSTKGEVYNLGGLKGPPRMLTATSVSSSCLLTSAQEGWMRGLGGRGRGSLQLGRGEVEVEEEAEAGEVQTELATPSPSQPW